MGRSWRIEHRQGSAQELHDLALHEPITGRALVVQELDAPALVLGSTQHVEDVDAAALRAAGVRLARRRSGGGAVLIRPGDHVWVDLVIAADDPLADADVGRAAWWVGEAFIRALGISRASTPGGEEVGVHRGGVTDRDAGAIACFAALGPGEVVVDGAKVLGVSQRRTRLGTRFQCVGYRSWEPELLLSLLSVSSPRSGAVATALHEHAAAVVPPGWDAVEDLLPSLP